LTVASGFAALDAGLMMACGGRALFTTNPVVVTTEREPLPVSEDMPSFKPAPTPLQRSRGIDGS
jgi:hypothetical protein